MSKIRIGLQIESTSPSVRQLVGSGKGVSEWDGIDPDEIVKVTHTVESSNIQEINPGIYYNIPSITTAKQGDTLFSDDGRLFVYDEAGSRWFLWYTFDNSSVKIHTNNTLKGEGTLDDPLSVNATVVSLKGDLNPLLKGVDNGDGTYDFSRYDGSDNFTVYETRRISDVDALRNTAGRYDREQVFLEGYHPGIKGSGDGLLYWDEDSVEADNGGTIFQVTGVPTGRWKRVYESPIDLTQMGALYNDEFAGAGNYDAIVRTINMNEEVVVQDKLYVESNNDQITSKIIKIRGEGNDLSEIVFSTATQMFTLGDTMEKIVYEDIKLTNENSGTIHLLRKETNFYCDELVLNNVRALGNFRFRFVSDGVGVDCKISKVLIRGCVFKNIATSFFVGLNMKYDLFEVIDNNINNFLYIFVNLAISDSSIQPFSRLLVVRGNVVYNDDDWFDDGSGGGSYFSFILGEGYRCVYENNIVEGMKAVTDRAVYDIYFSGDYEIYKNNVYRNNVRFVPGSSAGTYALFKAKGGSKECVGNSFIIEKSYIEDFIANNPSYGLDIANTEVSLISIDTFKGGEFTYKNNFVDVYKLGSSGNNISHQNIDLSNNTIYFEIPPTTVFVISHDSGNPYLSTDKRYVNICNNNVVSINKIEGVGCQFIRYVSATGELQSTISNNTFIGGHRFINEVTGKMTVNNNSVYLLPGGGSFVSAYISGSADYLNSYGNSFTAKGIFSARRIGISKAIIDDVYEIDTGGMNIQSQTPFSLSETKYTISFEYCIRKNGLDDIEFSFEIEQEVVGGVQTLRYISQSTGDVEEILAPNLDSINTLIYSVNNTSNVQVARIRLYKSSGSVPYLALILDDGNDWTVKEKTYVR